MITGQRATGLATVVDVRLVGMSVVLLASVGLVAFVEAEDVLADGAGLDDLAEPPPEHATHEDTTIRARPAANVLVEAGSPTR